MRAYVITPLLLLFTASLAFGAPAGSPRAQVIVFSNSNPHITVIDGQTHQVVRTANVPQLGVWGWNDDNNYFDGTNLWLTRRNPDTNAAEVVLLNVDTLTVSSRIPIGQETGGIFSGKASRAGKVLFAKFGSGELVAIDVNTHATRTVKLPINGGVACDVEVAIGFDKKERAYIPTMAGNTVVVVDPASLQVLQVVRFTEGTRPWMATATPDGRRLWVQEQTGNTNAIMNSMTLDVVARTPTGPAPDAGSFSPDGRVHFTGHFTNNLVVAHETDTFREIWRVPVGANTRILGVHPAGTFVYAIMTSEGAVGVLEASTGRVVTRVALGTNPTGIFVRTLK